MANKLLNLKLSYKGKLLDTIKEGNDFTKHWYIGSDRHIFWQILDDSKKFPAKHKFLVKHGDAYSLQLPEGSALSCSKDNQLVDAAFLQQNGILKGSSLLIRNDMACKVQVHPDYDIQYSYEEFVVYPLGVKEQKVVTECSHKPPLDPIERANRGIILLFLILGLAFSLIYDVAIKQKAAAASSLSQTLAELERARRIDAQVTDKEKPAGQTSDQLATETPADTKPQTQKPTGGTTQGPALPRSTQAVFGNLKPGSASAPAYRATVLDEFVTARPGNRGGTGPGGSAPGGAAFNPSAGAGYSGTFDPSATAGYNQTELGAVVTGKTPTGGITTRPAGQVVTYTGSAAKLEPLAPERKPIAQTPQIERIIQSFQTPEVTTLKESSIVGSTSGKAADTDNIFAQLSPKKGQITQSYRKSSAVKASSGSITVVMYINANGGVVADVIPNSATFTESFLQDVKTIVENWHFSVSKKTSYQFQIRLSQS